MKSILFKEIKSFFGSPIGYLVIAIFLLMNGLFLFVFEGEYNLLNSGFADLTPFFTIAPWILIFLIPAVTMRSLSDERKQGTLELLLTKPLTSWQIALGKFFGAFFLIVIALVPTLVYAWTLSSLGMPEGNLDFGSTAGSYFGLLFLVASYAAVGIFTSSVTDNQIVAFILAVFLCFVLYFGFEGLASSFRESGDTIASFGMDSHFRSMGRGVIDTRDVLYFVSVAFFFLALTVFRLGASESAANGRFSGIKSGLRKNGKRIAPVLVLLIAVNFGSANIFKRFDLTGDGRYTLSETALNIAKTARQPLYVDVFLKGNFPGEFKRLQTETQQLLEEFKAYNSNIVFEFVDPLENEDEREQIMQTFIERGLTPVSVTLDERGKQTQETVFPWAIATYGGRSVKVPLLKNMMGASTQDKVVSSVQHLEYAFANAFNTVTKPKEKKVAILKGNGEMRDLFIADFVRQVRENYGIGTFTLDSVSKQPNETLKYLRRYDLVVIAKPTERFTEEEKEVLDQYIVGGGKTLWMLDNVRMEMDSLYNTGASLAFPNDLNLDDMFFRYGVRIPPKLVKDLMATPIALASGEQGSATQYQQYPWFFSPLVYPQAKHPIVSNLDALKFEFTGGIELLGNGIRKTVLLQSSPYSKAVGAPVEIRLDMVQERPEQKDFKNAGNIPVAVLLEGPFASVYRNRVLPFEDKTFRNVGSENKMIVIADGDVVKNQFDKNFQPLELGYDKWTGQFYANKEFLMNCVNYLLDDNGLINIRGKEVNLPMLDKEKVYERYTSSQVITVGVPIAVLALFGVLFTWLRRRRYAR
jgi:ABC-2 type transport system permease protein